MNEQRTGQRSSYSSRPQQTRTENQGRSNMPPPAGAGNQAPAVAKPAGKQRLFEKFGEKFGVDSDLLVDTLKATCFRGQKADAPPITNEQLVALLIVADQYGLNPFTKEIYAYPDKGGGIVPVVSVDGWIRIINEHPDFDGMEIRTPETMITDESTRKHKHKPCWEWMEVTIFRKGRSHQQAVVEFFDEVYRQSLNAKNNDGQWYEIATPWQSHTKRMMRHKSIIQAGRVTFGFAGIYDEDEAQRIMDDERVVATVGPTSRTEQAKDALKQRASTTVSAAKAPEAEKAQPQRGDAPAAHAPRQPPVSAVASGSGGAGQREPWDEPVATTTAATAPTADVTDSDLIAAMKRAKSMDELGAAWDVALATFDQRGLSEPPIDVEANYHMAVERLGAK